MKKMKQLIGLILLSFTLMGCQPPSSADPELSKAPQTEKAASHADGQKNESSVAGEKQKKANQELGQLQVHYIDAGQADATLFEFADKDQTYHILYDTGDWNKDDVVHYLQKQGIDQLDLVIVSHPDADHIGQLAKIIDHFDVEEVWMSGNTSTSDTYQQALKAIDEQGIGYYEPRMGETFDIGPLGIRILYPEEITGKTNEESLSMMASYGETDFLFTGDASKTSELNMIASGEDLQAEILSLGHHGSNTASHPDFIDAVDPEIAIYSAGKDNSYGHPHQEVVSLMKQQHIPLYGTDVDGTITVTTDGKDYQLTTEKSGKTTKPAASKNNDASSKTAASSASSNETRAEEQKEQVKDDQVDLNQASIEELQTIVHIGPSRVQEIVKNRPFKSLDDLLQIEGIGPSRLEAIKQEGKAAIGGGN